jgi:hypothetical protein
MTAALADLAQASTRFTPVRRQRCWIALQVIAVLTFIASFLLIESLGSSLTLANYTAQFGSVPAQLSGCAYILPSSPANLPVSRGPLRREALCFFGSRHTHQEAYVAAWVATGLGFAVLLWTVTSGGKEKRRERQRNSNRANAEWSGARPAHKAAVVHTACFSGNQEQNANDYCENSEHQQDAVSQEERRAYRA